MKILLFEAVTGGGFLRFHTTPSGSMVKEGLSMVAALFVDLMTVSTSNATNISAIQLLLQQLTNVDEEHQIFVLWDERLGGPFGNKCPQVLASSLQPTAPHSNIVNLHTFDSAQRLRRQEESKNESCFESEIVEWDARTMEPLKRIPVACSVDQWLLDSETLGNSQTQKGCPTQVIPICSDAALQRQLKRLAEEVDLVLVIAPEPTLSEYCRMLMQWQAKLLNLPAGLLSWAQQKSNYTTLPYAQLQMANRKLLLLNGKLDWNDDSVLLIKPNVSCGASDAWQFCYSRNHKFTGERDWQELAKICSLNVEVDQSYLIMPWSDGRPVSVSFLATPTGLFQFPPCEQLISLSPKLSVEQFAAAKVSYKGSKWADTCSREVIANQLPEILSQLIPPDFRNQLRGWFGIDLMIKDSQVDIIDFNGRWTSSYNLIRQLMVQS